MTGTALSAMTEQQLLDAVLELAEFFGWRAIHHRPAMNRRGRWSTPMSGRWASGWPDLFLVRDGPSPRS